MLYASCTMHRSVCSVFTNTYFIIIFKTIFSLTQLFNVSNNSSPSLTGCQNTQVLKTYFVAEMNQNKDWIRLFICTISQRRNIFSKHFRSKNTFEWEERRNFKFCVGFFICRILVDPTTSFMHI